MPTTNPPSQPVDAALDRRLMAAALRLGRRNLGRTGANPAVGALIVKPDIGGPRVLGRGWTALGGRPHAEVLALAEAGEDARGATAYVTLEPCSHTGQTPPCANALIEAGVARVVTAMTDPDPRVSGKGLAMLKSAGIEVTNGVLEAEAALAHGGHIARITKGRPWVTLKLAISADGMIGRGDQERMMVTGRPAFERVQAMRAEYDTILVGLGTVIVDDPRLTVRRPPLPDPQPVRVVVDSQARIALDTNLVKTARDVPFWLMVGEDADAARVAALEEAGVVVKRVGSGSGGVDLNAVFARLAEDGRSRVLVEGGAKIAAGLVSLDLADEVIFFRAPVIVGPEGVRALAGQALSAIERSPRYRLIDDAVIGEDRLRRYLRAR